MESFKTYCTIVYAKNTSVDRANLWPVLVSLGTAIQEPCILRGDLNSVLSTEDRMGSPITPG